MHRNLRTALDDGHWGGRGGQDEGGASAKRGAAIRLANPRVAAPREGCANGLTPVPVDSEFLRQRTWNDFGFCHCQKLRLLYPAGDYCPGRSKRSAGDLSGPLIVVVVVVFGRRRRLCL